MTKEEYKAERKRIGVWRSELARTLGVSDSTIMRRENGTIPITKEAELAIRSLPPSRYGVFYDVR